MGMRLITLCGILRIVCVRKNCSSWSETAQQNWKNICKSTGRMFGYTCDVGIIEYDDGTTDCPCVCDENPCWPYRGSCDCGDIYTLYDTEGNIEGCACDCGPATKCDQKDRKGRDIIYNSVCRKKTRKDEPDPGSLMTEGDYKLAQNNPSGAYTDPFGDPINPPTDIA